MKYKYLEKLDCFDKLKEKISTKCGVFGADMKIELVNNGPFTMMIDSDEVF